MLLLPGRSTVLASLCYHLPCTCLLQWFKENLFLFLLLFYRCLQARFGFFSKHSRILAEFVTLGLETILGNTLLVLTRDQKWKERSSLGIFSLLSFFPCCLLWCFWQNWVTAPLTQIGSQLLLEFTSLFTFNEKGLREDIYSRFLVFHRM